MKKELDYLNIDIDTVKSLEEITAAFLELFLFSKDEDYKKSLFFTYKKIKDHIKIKPHRKILTKTISVIKNCNKCSNFTLKNNLKLSSGKVVHVCTCIKKLKPKNYICNKCKNTKIIIHRCPTCKGKGFVHLIREL